MSKHNCAGCGTKLFTLEDGRYCCNCDEVYGQGRAELGQRLLERLRNNIEIWLPKQPETVRWSVISRIIDEENRSDNPMLKRMQDGDSKPPVDVLRLVREKVNLHCNPQRIGLMSGEDVYGNVMAVIATLDHKTEEQLEEEVRRLGADSRKEAE